MAAPSIEHIYRYAYPSGLVQGSNLRFSTSGGTEEFPYFFQGRLTRPRPTALLLRALSKVVSARFHLPPAMLQYILNTRDPVVTSGGGMLRFEGFSACCSTYARVDVTPDGYEGVVAGHGTTNVDFNADMRAALAQIRDGEGIGLAVGTDEVTLLRGAEQIVERRVKLPLRWLKGFVELQAFQARMSLRFSLGKVEMLRFLRALPRSVSAKNVFWLQKTGSSVRLSQRASPGALRIAGIERLRLLEELAPIADGLTVFGDERGEASEWRMQVGPLSFQLTLSAEVWRGFSGEGQVLQDLAAPDAGTLWQLAQGILKWQAELRPTEFAGNWDASPGQLRQAFAVLGSRGLVGYDLSREAYYHRELPFDLQLVEGMHPRLKAARQLAESGGIRMLHVGDDFVEAEVPGSDVVHRVKLVDSGDRCTCPWFAKHRNERGPCKHILAVQILNEEE